MTHGGLLHVYVASRFPWLRAYVRGRDDDETWPRTRRETPSIRLVMHNAEEENKKVWFSASGPWLSRVCWLSAIHRSLTTSVSWITERCGVSAHLTSTKDKQRADAPRCLFLICLSTSAGILYLSSSSSLWTAGGKERTSSLFPWKPSLLVCGMRDVLCVD